MKILAALRTLLSLCVCLSLHLSVTPFSQCSCHSIIIKYWQKWCPCKSQGQRSKVKVTITEVKINFAPIWVSPDCNSSLNSQMAMKLCTKLAVHRRGTLCFSRSSIKSHGHTGKKIDDFDPNWVFLDFNTSLNSQMPDGYKTMHKVWSDIEEMPYCFSRSHSQGWKIDDLALNLSISGWLLQFKFMDGYKIVFRSME